MDILRQKGGRGVSFVIEHVEVIFRNMLKEHKRYSNDPGLTSAGFSICYITWCIINHSLVYHALQLL